MENFDLTSSSVRKGENAPSNPMESHSPIRRELDSVDDFEHLDHDGTSMKNQAANNDGQLLDFLKSDMSQPPKTQNHNLLDDLQSFQSGVNNQFTSDLQKGMDFSGLDAFTSNSGHVPNIVDSTKSFMDFERQPIAPPSNTTNVKSDYGFDEHLSTQFDDDHDDESDFKDFSKPVDDFIHSAKPELDEFKDFIETDNKHYGQSGFSDVIYEPKQDEARKGPEQTKTIFDESLIEEKPIPVLEPKPAEPPSVKFEPQISKPFIEPAPEPPITTKQEISAKVPSKPIQAPSEKIAHKPVEKKEEREVIAAEVMFCQMGLDAWFNPERLNPKVESLIYWRCPRKSGIVFGVSLALLLALSCFSLISVLAYASLTAVCGCMAFRIYRNVLQAIQKTSDGHPFKDLLETDVSVSQEKAQQVASVAVTHVNAAVSELRRLFLVEDLVDSTKFIVLLWCLTYLGSWFNGMTLIIIAFVALFTLPKVYETNKTQIDANLDVVRSKLQEITSKVRAAVPIGKKAESDKDK